MPAEAVDALRKADGQRRKEDACLFARQVDASGRQLTFHPIKPLRNLVNLRLYPGVASHNVVRPASCRWLFKLPLGRRRGQTNTLSPIAVAVKTSGWSPTLVAILRP
jgi:hypothetical protein